MKKPLDHILVLNFSQYLAGPWAAVKLADLGARVIKIERPGGGDNSRRLLLSNLVIDGDSTVFHSMNRGKESYTADLKSKAGLEKVRNLVRQADVLIENFRPGVMDKIGLGYEAVRELNPALVYSSVTGYGSGGPLKDKPGQDLLVQSLTGIPWMNGNADQPPVPLGFPVVDEFTSANLVQGILAALIKRSKDSKGARIEISLLESALDFQFEVLTVFLNNGGVLSERSGVNNAHNFLGAPYGIYATSDSFIALSMGSLTRLAELLGCDALNDYSDPESWFVRRDEIKLLLADHLKTDTTAAWLGRLEPADYWCAPVLNTEEIMKHDAAVYADMVQDIVRSNGAVVRTTRSPLRIDGEKLFNPAASPVLGEHTEAIDREFSL